MSQTVISYFVHAEIQLLQLPGLSQGRGQVFTGMWGHFTALQPERFQSAVLIAKPLHKFPDSIVADAVVSQVQLSQVGFSCVQDCC